MDCGSGPCQSERKQLIKRESVGLKKENKEWPLQVPERLLYLPSSHPGSEPKELKGVTAKKNSTAFSMGGAGKVSVFCFEKSQCQIWHSTHKGNNRKKQEPLLSESR